MRSIGRAVVVGVLGASAALAGCDPTLPTYVVQDAATEASSSGGDGAMGGDGEAGEPADAAPDVGADALPEADAEAGDSGAEADAAADGSIDATLHDATVDATLDATADATLDATADAGEDAPDDAAGDAGEAGPPSLCASVPYLFCDGFEQSLLTHWAAISSSGAQISIDSTHVYRGRYAMHANSYAVAEAGTSEWAYVMKYGTTPWPTHFFTRLFVYMPSPAPTFTFNFLDLQENGGTYDAIEMRVHSNDLLAMLTYSTAANQAWESADASFAFDQWTCFEVEVDTVAETNRVFVNDVEVADLAHSNLALGQLGNLTVGLGFAGPPVQGSYDLWIDEVALNSARIGCAN